MIDGIDVSHYQGTIDWTKVAKAGNVFAFIKATEGNYTIDPAFSRNWKASADAGLIRGAYHFFRPGRPAALQADLFLRTVRPMPGMLPPVLDLEGGDWNTVPVKARLPMILEWLVKVESNFGARPLVYLGPAFAQEQLGGNPPLGAYQLWLAQYAPAPAVPKPWTHYTFWQHTDKGNTTKENAVPGITGSVDCNYFNGSIDDLKALTL